jgi:aerobic carbon-monoxide dehydrogenase large subunit
MTFDQNTNVSAYREQRVKRREDLRLVRGAGRYTGDLRPEGLLYVAFLRSPHPHARINRIAVAAAAAAEGVVAVITGADLYAAGLKDSPGGFAVPRPDGRPAPKTNRPALAADRVRHVGEAVVAVVAETQARAVDACELIEIEYEELPAVTTVGAMTSGIPALWDEAAQDNIAFRWEGGDAAAVDAALRTASHVTIQTMRVSRVAVNSMEPRNVLVIPQDDERLLVHASHQSPFTLRDALEAVGFEKGGIHVQVGDVGGSFGLKMGIVLEAIVVAHAARTVRRPVFWESTRNEAFQSDDHARELEATAEIGFDKSNRIVGLRVSIRANLGAYVTGKSGWTIGNIGGVAGVYAIPAIHAEVYGILTNTVHTAAYRGAGRPEATYVIERVLDVAAVELGVSPFELRRVNLIAPSAMPYQTALTFKYDCGEFEEGMKIAAGLADLAGFEVRRTEAGKRGKLRGIGISNSIEVAGGPFKVLAPDMARVSLLTDGRLLLQTGSMSVGQSFETVFPQLIADMFGIPADQVEYNQGDTDVLPSGRGNGGSSALCVGGSAVSEAATVLRGDLIEIAAKLLGAPADSVSLSNGMLRSQWGNRTLTLAELAAETEPASERIVVQATGVFKPPAETYPNGTHICEVEVDPETGEIEIVSYTAVEDIGNVINPMTAEGQIQGGVVQGIGQAFGEEVCFDTNGQLLTASFMDYAMPRAGDFPNFKLAFHPVPTKVNPLGAKGVGEAGTVGALSAAMNAINAALAPLGIRHLDMPATPARVWAAIQKVQKVVERSSVQEPERKLPHDPNANDACTDMNRVSHSGSN